MDRRQLIVRTLCHCDILPRMSNISNHEKSEKHKRGTPLQGQTRINPLNTQLNPLCHFLVLLGAHPILHVSRISVNVRKTPRQDMDKVKAVELQTAVRMTCHCVIRTVDHLSEIMIAHWHGSILEHTKLHRSKCAFLIKNVISSALKTDLTENFQNKKYVIISDESTDIST